MSRPKVIFIVGPTASGKSNLALTIATECSGHIVNADSLQVYKRLNIGTAKPSKEERMRLPHHLFDFVSPPGEYTAGQYREDALKVIDLNRQTPLLFTGGSGFYLQALEKGMYAAPEIPEEILSELRQAASGDQLEQLYEELKAIDPTFAAKIAGNDRYRIVRALGIYRAHKVTPTQLRSDFDQIATPTVTAYKVGLTLSREKLRLKVRQRILYMFEAGWLEEVQGLIDEGLCLWPPLQSVGYKECLAHLNGQLTRDEAVDEIERSTMRLAKRQMTWFRRDKDIRWFDAETELSEAEKHSRSLCQQIYEP